MPNVETVEARLTALNDELGGGVSGFWLRPYGGNEDVDEVVILFVIDLPEDTDARVDRQIELCERAALALDPTPSRCLFWPADEAEDDDEEDGLPLDRADFHPLAA